MDLETLILVLRSNADLALSCLLTGVRNTIFDALLQRIRAKSEKGGPGLWLFRAGNSSFQDPRFL